MGDPKMETVAFLEVVNKGKKYFFVEGKRINADVAFKLLLYAADSDCNRTECKGDKVRRYKTLYFNSDDAYIVRDLLGD